jgi:hypothetical protein
VRTSRIFPAWTATAAGAPDIDSCARIAIATKIRKQNKIAQRFIQSSEIA